jgi:hypothetical protein
MVNFRHICKENVSEKHPPVCDLFAGENFKELHVVLAVNPSLTLREFLLSL